MTHSLGQKPWAQDLMIRSPWCHYCHAPVAVTPMGRPNVRRATLDHIVPKALGGTSARINIVVACHACNKRKGSDRHPCWCAQCREAFAFAATRHLSDGRCAHCTRYTASYPHEHTEQESA